MVERERGWTACGRPGPAANDERTRTMANRWTAPLADERVEGGDDLLLAREADVGAGRRLAGACPALMPNAVTTLTDWSVPGLLALGVALMLAALVLAW